MGFKEWWKKQRFWVKGGFFGIITALIIYILSFSLLRGRLGQLLWLIAGKPFCALFKSELGEPCAFDYLIFGWLFLMILYGLIGVIIGFTIDKIKK